MIDIYAEHGKEREQFAKFVSRYGFDNLYEEVANS
jgi:precorrin-3B C17-methyltransferase